MFKFSRHKSCLFELSPLCDGLPIGLSQKDGQKSSELRRNNSTRFCSTIMVKISARCTACCVSVCGSFEIFGYQNLFRSVNALSFPKQRMLLRKEIRNKRERWKDGGGSYANPPSSLHPEWGRRRCRCSTQQWIKCVTSLPDSSWLLWHLHFT